MLMMRTMSRTLLTVMALALSASARAQHGPWTTPPVNASGVQYRTFQSANAGATVSFHVWLPPQYQSMPTARFPVLYWLHGSGSPIAGSSWAG
jgi:enterochelin esterase-like enzyme